GAPSAINRPAMQVTTRQTAFTMCLIVTAMSRSLAEDDSGVRPWPGDRSIATWRALRIVRQHRAPGAGRRRIGGDFQDQLFHDRFGEAVVIRYGDHEGAGSADHV